MKRLVGEVKKLNEEKEVVRRLERLEVQGGGVK